MRSRRIFRSSAAAAIVFVVLVTLAIFTAFRLQAGGIAPQTSFLSVPQQKNTYTAVWTGFAPAASATDFAQIIGSATKTVRVRAAECQAVATAATLQFVRFAVRSTASTGGTPTAITGVPHDANAPAATAVVNSFAANPSPLGTLVGYVNAGYMIFGTLASPGFSPPWFGVGDLNGWGESLKAPLQEIVLRGTAQQLALNANGASFPAGTAMSCRISWTEE